jgi:glycosyltransferase involved in cell wall biosynthesis
MSNPVSKKKLALLINIIAPARLGLYAFLAEQFDLLILHGGNEANRDSWADLERQIPHARVVRAWGWQYRHLKKVGREVFDEKFIHLTPGFFTELLRFEPDVIISNEMGFRSLMALTYGSLFRKPVWIWWGGTLHSERSIGSARKFLRKICSRWARHWITYGQTSTAYLEHLGVASQRILESQNAIDESRFDAHGAPNWTVAPRPVVLYTGQFIERKGVGFLLDAAAVLQKQGHRFSLLLVGSGRDKQTLEQRAEALGISDIYFYPSQPPEKMPGVYRSADVLVFPTLEDVWGLVANEAILCGIPVLCSKYAGCAVELFPPENIFAPEDLSDFSEKLRTAVLRQLPRTPPGKLMTTSQVGNAIVQELNKTLSSNIPAPRHSSPDFTHS